MVGLVCACLPSPIGRMGIAFAVWVVARRLFRWDFSLIPGIAWTWTANVFTAAPVYYWFVLTGQILLGRRDDLSGYETFVQTFTATMSAETGFIDALLAVGKLVVLEWASRCGSAAFRGPPCSVGSAIASRCVSSSPTGWRGRGGWDGASPACLTDPACLSPRGRFSSVPQTEA